MYLHLLQCIVDWQTIGVFPVDLTGIFMKFFDFQMLVKGTDHEGWFIGIEIYRGGYF